MKVQLAGHWNRGMGTQLCALSTFVAAGVNEIQVGHMRDFHAFTDYKKIFELSDLKIEFISTELPDGLFANDCFKIFSPYYVKARKNKNRPCVGMACYNGKENIYNLDNQDFTYPKNKFQPIENYAKIYSMLKELGFDIITLDSKDISRIDKSWIIENLCECVIGYEGGIAHLCHMLDTPFIMFPWNNNSGLEQLMHLDKKTYFLKDIEELLSWNENKFLEVIDNLRHSLGNNKLLTGLEFINIDEDYIITDIHGNQVPVYFTELEKEFFKNNIGHRKLAGTNE